MATELGKAYVQIMPSAQGIKGILEKELGMEVPAAGKSAGSLLGSNLVKTVSGVIAAAGIGKFLMSSLEEGGKLQQSLGGIETLFKDSADKVKQYANEAYKSTGLSANAYMENVTGFSASLLQSMGGDTAKAAEIANMAMVDMADNSNKMGSSMESIQNAYQGFAKQNYTMLDNLKLGYGGTKTEMERLLKDAQKLTGVKYDINSLSDVYSAIHVIQEELDITGTTAKESASTFSGSLASMQAALTNVIGKLSLGEDISQELKALFETVSTFLFDNLLPMVWNVVKGIPQALSDLITKGAPKLIESGGELIKNLVQGILESIPDISLLLLNLMADLKDWFRQEFPQFVQVGVEFLTNLGKGILEALPDLLITVAYLLEDLLVIFLEIYPQILQAGVDLLLNFIDGIVQNAPELAASFDEILRSLIETLQGELPKYFEKGWQILTSLIDGIVERLPDLIATAIQLMVDLIATLVEKFPDIVKTGVDIISNLLKGIVEYIPKLLEKLGRMGEDIIKKVGEIDLFKAGKAIIDGLLKGLKAAWDGVTGFIGSIADWIAKNKGPISYDRKLLIPAGKAIMHGLNTGLVDNFKSIKANVKHMAEDISDQFENEILNMSSVGSVVMDMSSVRMQNSDFVAGFKESEQVIVQERDVYIDVSVPVDGKMIAKQTVRYTREELSNLDRRENRKRGVSYA